MIVLKFVTPMTLFTSHTGNDPRRLSNKECAPRSFEHDWRLHMIADVFFLSDIYHETPNRVRKSAPALLPFTGLEERQNIWNDYPRSTGDGLLSWSSNHSSLPHYCDNDGAHQHCCYYFHALIHPAWPSREQARELS